MMSIHRSILLTLCTLLSTNMLNAQNFQFRQIDSLEVLDFSGNALIAPWSGGFWRPQLGELDLNKDGWQDLLVFDRIDRSHTCFVKDSTANGFVYKYAPEYDIVFPRMIDWMRTYDYNGDGLQDLFYSANGGSQLFKQELNGGIPRFNKITGLILADYGFGVTSNLYIDNGDIPAIDDIDGDGDFDVLSFDNLYVGQINFFENMSMDKYGVPDSLEFLATSRCWGRFTENSLGSNVILGLDRNCKITTPLQGEKKEVIGGNPEGTVHLGSTIMSYDPDRDGKKDLLMGDISFGNIIELRNQSVRAMDSIVAVDTLWPSYDKPVNIPLFPATFELDADEDGKKDIVAIPNAFIGNASDKSMWLYKNKGGATADKYEYQQNDFLQGECIDHGFFAAPITLDYDNDGDQDLILSTINDSSWTVFILYKNQGTNTNPRYQMVDTDYLFASFNQYSFAVPAKGDLDDDGDPDLLFGLENGTIVFYENYGIFNGKWNLAINTINYSGIDVGAHAAPELADLNGDGLLDLLIGDRQGKLHYYENKGSKTNPDFSIETNADYGKIRLNEYFTAYPVPRIADLDNNGLDDLIVGTERGLIYFFPNISANPTDSFISSTNNYKELLLNKTYDKQMGYLLCPWFENLNGDQFPDMMVGTYRGGIQLFANAQVFVGDEPLEKEDLRVKIYPNPNKGSFVIETSELYAGETMTLELYNTLGSLVERKLLSGNQKVWSYSNGSLSPGVYFVRVAIQGSQNKVFYGKLSVQK